MEETIDTSRFDVARHPNKTMKNETAVIAAVPLYGLAINLLTSTNAKRGTLVHKPPTNTQPCNHQPHRLRGLCPPAFQSVSFASPFRLVRPLLQSTKIQPSRNAGERRLRIWRRLHALTMHASISPVSRQNRDN